MTDTVHTVHGSAPRSPWVPERPDTANIVLPPPPITAPAPQHAEHDPLIERSDLGPQACTLIVAGDVIPPHLADRPRRPARPRDTPASKGRKG